MGELGGEEQGLEGLPRGDQLPDRLCHGNEAEKELIKPQKVWLSPSKLCDLLKKMSTFFGGRSKIT